MKNKNFIELLNSKEIYSRTTDKLVEFYEEITDEIFDYYNKPFSDGFNFFDEDYQDDISAMYCILKNGEVYNLEDFYYDYGAFSKNKNDLPNNIKELIKDRNTETKTDNENIYNEKYITIDIIDNKYKDYELQLVINYKVLKSYEGIKFNAYTSIKGLGINLFEIGAIHPKKDNIGFEINEIIRFCYAQYLNGTINFDDIVKIYNNHKNKKR